MLQRNARIPNDGELRAGAKVRRLFFDAPPPGDC